MPDPKAAEKSTLTNVLLQQILDTNKAMLVALGNIKANSDQILKTEQAALVVATDSRDYLAQLAETGGSGGGGGEHTYTVTVQQLDTKRKNAVPPPKPTKR